MDVRFHLFGTATRRLPVRYGTYLPASGAADGESSNEFGRQNGA